MTIAIQRSILSPSALAEQVLSTYNLPADCMCRFWNHSINDTYLVQAGASKYILRISPTDWRTTEQINAEIELLNYLDQHHVSAPKAVAQRNGQYIQALNAPEGIRYGVLFTFVPGAPPDLMKEQASHHYGQAIAKFHTLTDEYPSVQAGFRFDPVDMVDEPLARIKPLFTEQQDAYNYLLEISTGLKQATDKLPRPAPAYGICHGDVNANNFHMQGEAWSLIDFEYSGYGWRIFDIATFINNHFIEHGRTDETKKTVDAFLAGYQTIRSLSQSELEALPSFVIMRQIWLLGISAKYIPKSTISLPMHEGWMFQHVMPFIRSWMKEPWHAY